MQAIVRGKGEKNKTVTLTLEGADIVTKTVKLRNSLGGKEDDADLSRNGSEVTRTGRVEYIEPMTFSSTGYGYATGDVIKRGYEISAELGMPTYPADGSIAVYENIIIVRLS